MAGITKNTSFTLDGVKDLKIGQWGDFRWWTGGERPWMGVLEVGRAPEAPLGLKVNINLAGDIWEAGMIRLNMGSEFRVTITDNVTTGAFIEYLGLSHGSSTVTLNFTSVQWIKGGRGDDNVTLGAGSKLEGGWAATTVDLGRGNNTVVTGSGWVDSIICRIGDDTVTIGSGGASSVMVGAGNNTVKTGSGWVDAIISRDGDDIVQIGSGGAGSVMVGGGNNTVKTGTGWVDAIISRDGNDTVEVGRGGAGLVSVGGGDDTVIFNRLDNPNWGVGANAGSGNDTASFAKFGLGVKVDLSEGGAFDTGGGDFFLFGFENIIGSALNDELIGNEVNNKIQGGKGNDKIVGAGGADILTGGLGADAFIYRNLADSATSAAGMDTIRDFSQAEGDRIDLRSIDAKTATVADDAFKFIGKKAFAGNAGELRYEQKNGNTFVYGDVDGDGIADFGIKMISHIDLVKGDFWL